jgi:membrane protein
VFRFVKTLLQQSVLEYLRDDCGHLAAAISYYALFSLFPLLIFVVALAGLLIQDRGIQDDIVNEVLKNIPLNEGEGRNSVTDAVRGVADSSKGALGVLALAGMAWAGSSLFGALRKALNIAFDDTESRRPFVQQKAIDLALLLALLVFFLASIGATAFLRIVRTNSAELGALGDAAESAGLLWDAASYAIPLVFSFIAFTALYCLVPSRLRSPLDVWPGALVAALMFEIAKLGFSFYLEKFTSYEVVMGSLGAVAAFLFWIYVSANIMLFGAEVASEYPRVPETGYKQPVLKGLKPSLTRRAWEAFRGLFVRSRKVDARAGTEELEQERPPGAAPTRRDAPRA